MSNIHGSMKEYLINMSYVKKWDLLATVRSRRKAGNMGKYKDLSDFVNGHIVMAGLVGCFWYTSPRKDKSGPRKVNKFFRNDLRNMTKNSCS